MVKKYYQLLEDLVAIKSVSPDKCFFDEIKNASLRLAQLLDQSGLHVQVITDFGNPIVLAKYEIGPEISTCLIYGHYDVQPADKTEGWARDPFELWSDSEKVYGRGVADDKGQILIYISTVCELIKKKKLGYNVVFLLEGEEEVGSPGLKKFLEEYKDMLKADFALISDSTVVGDRPCLDAGYRGACNAKLKLYTAKTDVHSGMYGGVVPNALHEANKLLSKLFDMNNRVTVPYFYYNVEDLHTDVLVRHKRMKVDIEKIKMDFGMKTIFKDKEYDYLTQVGLMPTIQITGIQSGYVGSGFKNAIPGSATIHLNFRLVKNQHIDEVMQAFEGWVKNSLPEYVDYELTIHDKVAPCKVDLKSKFHKKAETVLRAVWGKDVFYSYSGGTLPIVNLFADVLGIEVVLVPLANEDCNPHGVNENLDMAMIEKGLDFAERFLEK